LVQKSDEFKVFIMKISEHDKIDRLVMEASDKFIRDPHE
jgi:hypothetical protein